MNSKTIAKVICWLAVCVGSTAEPCSYPDPPEFSDVAERARNLLVIRIQSLEIRREPAGGNAYQEYVLGAIEVLEKYRDTSDMFLRVRFSNQWCGGLRLDVGGVYLVATNSSPPFVDLAPADKTIIDLFGDYSPKLPDGQRSRTLERLRSALRGETSFDIATLTQVQRMSVGPSPPVIPVPEG